MERLKAKMNLEFEFCDLKLVHIYSRLNFSKNGSFFENIPGLRFAICGGKEGDFLKQFRNLDESATMF